MAKSVRLDKLQKMYKFVCDEYLKKFIRKQGYEFTYITADYCVVCFIEQYYFNIEDIIYDINYKCPKGLIFKWQDESIDANINNDNVRRINYTEYLSGSRYIDT